MRSVDEKPAKILGESVDLVRTFSVRPFPSHAAIPPIWHWHAVPSR